MVDRTDARDQLAAVERMKIKDLQSISKERIEQKIELLISNIDLLNPYDPLDVEIRKEYAWCLEYLYFLDDDKAFTIDSIEGLLLEGYEKQDPQDTTDEKLLTVGAHLKLKYNEPEISIFSLTLSEKDIKPKYLSNFYNFWNMLREKDNVQED